MYNYNIVICDDDGQFVDELARQVKNIMIKNDLEFTITEFYDGNEMVNYCNKNHVDIILADIDMPTMDGFKAIEMIQKRQPDKAVVFITAHSELAYQAYDYHPYQFVSKTDLKKLDMVLSDLTKKIKRRRKSNEIVHIKLDNIIDINVNDVMYFKGKRNYITAHFVDEETTEIRGSIKSVYEQLADHGFVHVHRSYIVNCRFIFDFGTKTIILKNNIEIPVTRNTAVRQEAQKIYGKFNRELRW